MAIIDKIFDNMKDDKGLFQGGKHGRMFGRLQDALGIPGQKTSPYGGDERSDQPTNTEPELPTRFQRTNPYGHRLGEIDMGDQDPYEYLMENPGDLRSYYHQLGNYSEGYGKEFEELFKKNFLELEGGSDIWKTYYDDASGQQQSFNKGAGMYGRTFAALEGDKYPKDSTGEPWKVTDLVKDVAFSRKTDQRSEEFDRGLQYSEDVRTLGKFARESGNYRQYNENYPDMNEGAIYNRGGNLIDPRIEGTDEGGF